MSVPDASALLAFLQDEPGSTAVEEVLAAGATCGAANRSEVAQKILAHGRNWDLARALPESYGIRVGAVSRADAEWAARRWRRGEVLALADRLCLGLAERLDVEAWTADRSWGEEGRIRQVR